MSDQVSESTPATAGTSRIGHGVNGTGLVWTLRICLGLSAVSVFLPWFSMWAEEGWGKGAIYYWCPAGLTVFIFLPAAVSLGMTFLAAFPKRELISFGGAVVAFLMILVSIFAGKPSLGGFGPYSDMVQVSLVWGSWIALLASLVALGLSIVENLATLRSLARHRGVGAGVVMMAAMFIAGCDSKISRGNYDKIKDGMTQQQVEAILGSGKEQGSSSVNVPGVSARGVSVSGMSMSVKVLTWHDGSKIITITFQDEKVVGKAQGGL